MYRIIFFLLSISFSSSQPTQPTQPTKNFGKCTSAIEENIIHTSHWCKFGKMGSFPEFPSPSSLKYLKFGRQTVYRGPILKQRFACNTPGIGSSRYATVALSTKYLKTYEGGWAGKGKTGACGKCVCISIFGADDMYNKGLHKWVVLKYKGMSFMGKVQDRFGEGPDDAIDILQDRPYSFAPIYPNPNDNPNAPIVNNMQSPRIFNSTQGPESPESVGTWTALWQFVPCKWTHKDCAKYIQTFGYKTRSP